MSIRISGRILPTGRVTMPVPPPTISTISFVGSGSVPNAQLNSLSVNCSPGDVAFAIISGEIGIGLAAGWTPIYNIAITNQFSHRFAYRVCTGTSIALGGWSFGQLGYLSVYRGVNTTSPVGQQAGGHSIGNFVFPGLSQFSTNSWALVTASNRTGSTNSLNNNTLNNGVVTRRNNSANFPPNLLYGDTNGSRSTWSAATRSSIGVCLARVYEIKAQGA